MTFVRSIIRNLLARPLATSPLRPLSEAIHRIDKQRVELAKFHNVFRHLKLK